MLTSFGRFLRILDKVKTMTEPKRAKLSYDRSTNGLRLIWVDCEMTGLDVDAHHLVEVACVVTEGDPELTIVAESKSMVIHQTEEVLSGMSEWCKEHFKKNGLLAAIRDSEVSLEGAESELLDLVKEHTPPSLCPLAGNSVGYDRKFLEKYMPKFVEHVHHRTVDVSTLKELCRRWYPEAKKKAPKKKGLHRALDDIHESIEELRFYQKNMMVDANTFGGS